MHIETGLVSCFVDTWTVYDRYPFTYSKGSIRQSEATLRYCILCAFFCSELQNRMSGGYQNKYCIFCYRIYIRIFRCCLCARLHSLVVVCAFLRRNNLCVFLIYCFTMIHNTCFIGCLQFLYAFQ